MSFNVNVDSVDTPLEIKSGVVNVSGGSYISKNFDDSNRIIDNSGSGGPVSTVFINNGYLGAADVVETSVTISDDVSIRNDSKESDKKAIVVASGTEYGPVSLTWNGHDSEIFAFYVSNVTDVSDMIVNDFVLVDDADKLANALEVGNNVRLLNNINAANSVTFEIKKSLIIDGSGYTIFSDGTVNNTDAVDFRLFDIILADGEVTIKNLTLNLAGGNYSRTLNINNADGLIVNVVDSTIHNGTHYAINITGSNKDIELNLIRTDLTKIDSDVKGYCAIQTWSEKADINITNSKIYGNNTYSGASIHPAPGSWPLP